MCLSGGDNQENDAKAFQPQKCSLINSSTKKYYYQLFVVRGSIQNNISCFFYLPEKESLSTPDVPRNRGAKTANFQRQ